MKHETLTAGLIGGKLAHSLSPDIHAMIGGYAYRLTELEEKEVAPFFTNCPLDCFNVTVPYKKTVVPFMSALSPAAEAIGAVNTVVKTPKGFEGHNTDPDGFIYCLRRMGAEVTGKKAVVLGTGGAAAAAGYALKKLGAGETVFVSRKGPVTYADLPLYRGADILINATPVGMYPENGAAPVSLSAFERLSAVVDMIYNPAKTRLLYEAEQRGIPCSDGLPMLVAQAVLSGRIFTGEDPAHGTEEILRALERRRKSVMLIGMPAAGKTTVGRSLAALTGREFFDSDEVIAEKTGKTPSEIILTEGEERFRQIETEVLAGLGKRLGCVIAAGGGAVTRPENIYYLTENAVTVFLDRPPEELTAEGRPLSAINGVERLYAERLPLYRKTADITVVPCGSPEQTAKEIERQIGKKYETADNQRT